VLRESGPNQVATVELFSSEGCSSCPPADRWFSTLKDKDGLWKSFVPLVFHVEYWDYLGWKDELASRDHSDRQRAYATEWGNDHIYTPGVVLNGSEWTGWRNRKEPQIGEQPAVGVIRLEQNGKRRFHVSFRPAKDKNPTLVLNLALLGMGVHHPVTSGENRGETLRHDFVVLQNKSVSVSCSTSCEADFDIDDSPVKAERLAAVAWVSTKASIRPVQSVGGFLDPAPP
jgi:hypothetical protein